MGFNITSQQLAVYPDSADGGEKLVVQIGEVAVVTVCEVTHINGCQKSTYLAADISLSIFDACLKLSYNGIIYRKLAFVYSGGKGGICGGVLDIKIAFMFRLL